MIFRKIKKSNYNIIFSFLKNCGISICDYTCGAIIMWHEFYKTEFAVDDGFLFLRDTVFGTPIYYVPVGNGCFEQAVRKLESISVDGHIRLGCVPVDTAVRLQEIYGNKMTYSFNSDYSDYIYDASSMVSFAGKKMSAVRNHLNCFKKNYPDYKFVKLNNDCIGKVKDFIVGFNSSRDLTDLEAKAEADGTLKLLDNLNYLDWCGGFIELDNRVIAASIGEYAGDTLVIHAEKADISYKGCYQAIVNEFAKAFVKNNINFINREDDVGLEGLRKSKLAYRPVRLADKAEIDIAL